eukprot:CAMPEP_0168566902 /NCGR_PEP_ID=MMETSP0413-20121227/14684_1 /TAXON_ID=136452 /ORGANISM="Filamoeba nolandi, Strain NC-AS-23-1" /LENGTH=30 /DNA_ID= /DNA_START= /DNA_END= /DNA_ORIENTATION=
MTASKYKQLQAPDFSDEISEAEYGHVKLEE